MQFIRDDSLRGGMADLQPRCEIEGAAYTGLALEPNLPAHQLDQPAADCEPETSASMFARGRHVSLREGLEQFRSLLGRHADTGVAHRKLQMDLLTRLFQQLDPKPNLALLGEFHG